VLEGALEESCGHRTIYPLSLVSSHMTLYSLRNLIGIDSASQELLSHANLLP